MRTKITLITMFLVIALALSACAAPVGSSSKENIRTLSVNGSAQVNLTPDIAYVSIGVHSESPNAAEAVSSNNAQAQKVVDSLKALGIDEKDARTTNFSIYPQDEWGPNGERTGTRFVVDNTVYVTLRNIDQVGAVLQAAVDAGANSIYGIQFDVADKTTLLAGARQSAVENARTQAEELANSAGVTLGEVQSLNYYNSYPVAYDAKVGGGGAVAEAAMYVPVAPGQLTITVDVNMVFEIR